MLLLLSLSLAIKMGREAETVARIFISFRWGRVEGGRNIFHRGNAPNKTHRTHVKSLPRRAHCNFHISPPFAHYIIQQVNCHASSNIHYEPVNGSLLHRLNFAKHFPIWRNNRQAFRNDAGTRVDFFFFFLSFLFFEPSNDYSEWTFVIRLQSVIIKSANFRVDSSLESISNVGMKIPFRWKSMMKRDGKKKKKKKKWG